MNKQSVADTFLGCATLNKPVQCFWKKNFFAAKYHLYILNNRIWKFLHAKNCLILLCCHILPLSQPLTTTDLFSITIGLFKNVTEMESYNMEPFETSYLHSAHCLWDSAMLLYISTVCSFLLINIIPSYEHTTEDVWVVSSLGQLWIKFLWTVVYTFLHKHKILFLWDKYFRVGLLGHMTRVCLTL